MPVQAKGATIHCLGTVVWDKPAYHARNYIWPVGFKSTRKMPSVKNSKIHVEYTSEIVDCGDAAGFKVTPHDAPELSMVYNTASRVWMEMLKKIKRRSTISVSGPEMYGYSDPTVRMLFQELPNAEKCENYQWQDFEGSPTRADKIALTASGFYESPDISSANPTSKTLAGKTPAGKTLAGKSPSTKGPAGKTPAKSPASKTPKTPNSYVSDKSGVSSDSSMSEDSSPDSDVSTSSSESEDEDQSSDTNITNQRPIAGKTPKTTSQENSHSLSMQHPLSPHQDKTPTEKHTSTKKTGGSFPSLSPLEPLFDNEPLIHDM